MGGKLPYANSINIPRVIQASDFGIAPTNGDNTPAFRAAIAYLTTVGGGCLEIDTPGTYVFGSPDPANDWLMVELASNITIVGCAGVVLKAADGLNTATDTFRMFGYNEAGTLENVKFSGLTFDLNGANNLVPASDPAKPNQAIYILRAQRCKVVGCTFLNNAGRQTIHFGDNTDPQKCSDIEISDCTFREVGTAVPGNVEQTDHSSIYCQAFGAIIRGNYFSNTTLANEATAIESHSSRSIVDDNVIDRYGTGINIVATVNDQEDTVYADNIITQCQYGLKCFAYTGFALQRVKILDSTFEQASTVLTSNIEMNANIQANSTFTDIEFAGNTVIGAFTDFEGELHGVTIGRAGRIQIRDNKFRNITGSAVNTGTIATNTLEIDVDDNEIIDCGVTDESDARYAIRLDSAFVIKRARVRRNTVYGTIVSTADTSTGTPTLANVTDIEAWQVGMPVNGPGIPANTVVQSIDTGAGTITMDQNATATATVTVFAHSRVGLFSNADLTYICIESNDFDRSTIGVGGLPIQLTGTITDIRQQRFADGTATVIPAASPSAWVFGSPYANSSIVLDNLNAGIAQFAVAFNSSIAHWFLWTATQLQIATAGQTRIVLDNDQFNPASTNQIDNGTNGARWRCTHTLGVAFAFGSPTGPNQDDHYVQTNGGTVTLPAASAKSGQVFMVENTNGGSTATLGRTGGDTINGAAADKTIPVNGLVYVISDGVSDWRYCEIGVVT